MKRTTSATPLRNAIMFPAVVLLGLIVLVSTQSNAQRSRYSHPSDLNMNNEFQGGIRQYLACSQTHFDWGDERQRRISLDHDFVSSSVSAGVEELNIDPPSPSPRPVTAGGRVLARFLTAVGLVELALTASDIIDYVIDKFIVRPAWWRDFEESYIESQEAIDEQVKERVKECARLQVQFNLGGGTAVWGGNRSWDIYYTSVGTGGTVVLTLPRLRQGIVTVHQVSNGN